MQVTTMDVPALRRDWGRRVRERRLRRGLSLEALGHLIGMSAQRIHQIEHGRYGTPDEVRMRLAAKLSAPDDPVRVEDLFPYPDAAVAS